MAMRQPETRHDQFSGVFIADMGALVVTAWASVDPLANLSATTTWLPVDDSSGNHRGGCAEPLSQPGISGGACHHF